MYLVLKITLFIVLAKVLKCSYSIKSKNECWWFTRAFATYLKKTRKKILRNVLFVKTAKTRKEITN